MLPRVQYARTTDGLSIAFWTLGHGEPVVDMGTPPFSHIQVEWELPELRRWYERIAERHCLVRFDGRGTGLSTREISSYSLDGMVLDLEAVVDHLNLPSFTLIGAINSGVTALAYSAKHPELVARLVLWCAYAHGSEYFEDTGTLALREMVDRDWAMFTEVAAHSRLGWENGEPAKRFAALIRAAVTPGVQAAVMDGLRYVDATELLPSIQARTLVLQRERRGPEVARRIAAAIPNAQLVLFEGGSAAPYLSDAEEIWQVMADFIGPEPAPSYGHTLTPREIEVLCLIAAGKSNRQIAETLVISLNTVERHVSNVLAKIGVANRTEAAGFARDHRLLDS